MSKRNCTTPSCKIKTYKDDDKCIFHCDKAVGNIWGTKVELFWKSFIDSGYILTKNSIVPYYSNEKKINSTVQLNSNDTLVFENCTFVGDFFLRFENTQIKTTKVNIEENISFDSKIFK